MAKQKEQIRVVPRCPSCGLRYRDCTGDAKSVPTEKVERHEAGLHHQKVMARLNKRK